MYYLVLASAFFINWKEMKITRKKINESAALRIQKYLQARCFNFSVFFFFPVKTYSICHW
jgi:hypothetical protein